MNFTLLATVVLTAILFVFVVLIIQGVIKVNQHAVGVTNYNLFLWGVFARNNACNKKQD